MKTPEEKAKEIYDSFYKILSNHVKEYATLDLLSYKCSIIHISKLYEDATDIKDKEYYKEVTNKIFDL